MSRKYFRSHIMAKRVKFCMSCKVTQTDHPSCICQECRDKRCSNCGKISVFNTQHDDMGKPFCPKCFRTVITLAVQAGKTDSFTLAQRMDRIETDISMLKRILMGTNTNRFDEDRPPSDELKTNSRRRDFPSLASGADLDSRIDTLLENTDIPAPSVDDIKNRALEIMLESDRMAETIESETDKPEE